MAQSIRKVGIVGAGQMGNGIAHVCALAGIPVVINDVSPDRVKEALATINGNMAREVKRERLQTRTGRRRSSASPPQTATTGWPIATS